MKERPHNDRFRRAREDAMLKTLHETEGMASNEVLEKARKEAEQVEILKVGAESENRFTAYSRHFEIIRNVRDSNPEEDFYGKIDKWITLTDKYQLPELPVQVKSSRRDVRAFKQSHGFLKHGKMELVINCGPSVKPKDFKRQIRSEVGRIKRQLNENPALIKFLTKN